MQCNENGIGLNELGIIPALDPRCGPMACPPNDHYLGIHLVQKMEEVDKMWVLCSLDSFNKQKRKSAQQAHCLFLPSCQPSSSVRTMLRTTN